jgi:hypothetical protein
MLLNETPSSKLQGIQAKANKKIIVFEKSNFYCLIYYSIISDSNNLLEISINIFCFAIQFTG